MPLMRCIRCDFQTGLWITHYDHKKNEGLIRCQSCRTLMKVKIEEIEDPQQKSREGIENGNERL